MTLNEVNLLENKKQENRQPNDSPVFEIFGIKLFNDDLLILGLLFFIYSQGKRDDELFLVLLLLLF